MNDQAKERLNRLKGKYSQKYGHAMDEWSSMLFEEIQENFEQLTVQVTGATEAIKEAHSKIKKSRQVLQFASARQAWLYGLGKMVPLSVSICFMTALFFWYAYTEKRYKEIRNEVATYKNLPDFTALAQNGKIIRKDKVQYLVLKMSPDGKLTAGLHFVYDPKKQQVLVPLNQEPTLNIGN